ncbi:flagellar motor protein MotA [Aquibaculum arenosum]|uniref:Flagellar motor protein MotA n=1 Tax=Aquibaculum arenosum TaxID=3032591 RepID=A0ABT5YJJ4_9PROT|nr:flagellar motor protein MotA [Fodinicurvata sp. CAU 1616]MDF2095113.1 flagellar motor protein MotA [Fodinicurvata sp. CAU 1616]
MTRPQIYLIRMGIFLALVLAAGAALYPQLADAFFANAVLNGMILGVLVLGIIYSFRQVFLLRREIAFLAQLKRESSGGLIFPGQMTQLEAPRLLGPMARMLRERKGRITLSAMAMRTLQDGIRLRIDESHDISRYLIGLLIFLGLLGTFWGLVETVNAVGETIGALSLGDGDAAALFGDLQRGLQQPLGGMGTAFSSSLFGLAGSLVLGFLELQSGQAHNRFMNEMEEWLSGMTRIGGSSFGGGEGEASVPAYLQALLEQTADSLENLQNTIQRGEEDKQTANRNLATLTERLTLLTDQMRTEQEVLRKLAETHAAIRPLLAQLSESQMSNGGMDDATRDHIRNIDMHLSRMANEMRGGREQTVEQIRSEIRLLARTIAALAEEG